MPKNQTATIVSIERCTQKILLAFPSKMFITEIEILLIFEKFEMLDLASM